jgi:hypothetical protein
MNSTARILAVMGLALAAACAGTKGTASQPQPVAESADAGTVDAAQAAGAETVEAEPPAQPPPISECMDWKPKKLLDEAGEILSNVKDKSVAELKSVKCFEKPAGIEKAAGKKKKIFLGCEVHECHAWIEYWSVAGTDLQRQLDIDGAMSNYLMAAMLARECQVGGSAAADMYIKLGVILIDGYGEIMKGSLAFRWALLHEWDVQLPENPAPNVKKTFDVVKQSMGAEPFSCIEEQ